MLPPHYAWQLGDQLSTVPIAIKILYAIFIAEINPRSTFHNVINSLWCAFLWPLPETNTYLNKPSVFRLNVLNDSSIANTSILIKTLFGSHLCCQAKTKDNKMIKPKSNNWKGSDGWQRLHDLLPGGFSSRALLVSAWCTSDAVQASSHRLHTSKQWEHASRAMQCGWAGPGWGRL